MAPLANGLVSGKPPFSSYAALSLPMRASRLPQACFRGQVQGPGGSTWPKKRHPWACTLVFPNWSKYLRKSRTWLELHCESATGGLWFLKYCPKVFQSLLFWDSYLLRGCCCCCCNCCWCCWCRSVISAAVAEEVEEDLDDPSAMSFPLVDISESVVMVIHLVSGFVKLTKKGKVLVLEGRRQENRSGRKWQIFFGGSHQRGLVRRHGMGPMKVL